MGLFKLNYNKTDLSDGYMEKANKEPIDYEKDFENWLENSPHVLFENDASTIMWIGRQVSTTTYETTKFPDLMGIDSNGDVVLVELKKGRTPREVVALSTPFQNSPKSSVKNYPFNRLNVLAFSIKPELRIPPSLSNIFKELYSDLGVSRSNGDLRDWAEQGVLLLNRVLTVEHGMANSHGNLGWKYFTESIIKSVSEKLESVVFILWGKQAQDCKTFINLSKHMVIEGPHPSPLSAHRGFLGSKPFSATNKYLESKNKNAIKW